MSQGYRVETASSGRAVCHATECKNAKVKIGKDELRFGVWVPFQESGSFHWKHWGCVSGKQLQNIREYLENPNKPGEYRFDYLDGYDGEEKNSLDRHPDLQEKVRRVIHQGFIDPEDWNGDPEMNKLGEVGLRTTETKKKMRQGKKERDQANSEMQDNNAITGIERGDLKEESEPETKKDIKSGVNGKPALKKRGRAKKGSENEEGDFKEDEDEKPAKKKRGRAKKGSENEEGDFKEDEDEKPVKKKRAIKVEKEPANEEKHFEEGEDGKPAKNKRAIKVKKETANEDTENSESKPPSNRRRKATIKNETNYESSTPNPIEAEEKPKKGRKRAVKIEVDDSAIASDSKPAANQGRKRIVKKEQVNEQNQIDDLRVKGEPSDAVNLLSGFLPVAEERKPKVSNSLSAGVANEVFKEEDTGNDLESKVEEGTDGDVTKTQPKTKSSKGKKATSRTKSSKSARSTRNSSAAKATE